MKALKDRRHFVKNTVSVGGAFILPAIPSFLLESCKQRGKSKILEGRPRPAVAAAVTATRKRMSAHNPVAARTLQLYGRAHQFLLKKDSFAPGISNWNALALVHQNCCPHGNWYFLPWHRVYVFFFENTIREVLKLMAADPTKDLATGTQFGSKVSAAEAASFNLPYWDWENQSPTIMGRVPLAARRGGPIFWPTISTSRSRATGVSEGQVGIDQRYVGPQAIRTVLGSADFIALASGRSTTPRSEESQSQGNLESMPHNMTHVFVGGDMGAFLSPKDPIFWLHHCNVDRLWALWAADRRARSKSEIPPNTIIGIKTNTWLKYPLNKSSGTDAPSTFLKWDIATKKLIQATALRDAYTPEMCLSHSTGDFSYDYALPNAASAGLNLNDEPENPLKADGQSGVTQESAVSPSIVGNAQYQDTPMEYVSQREIQSDYSVVLNQSKRGDGTPLLRNIGYPSPFEPAGETKYIIFALDLDQWIGPDSIGNTIDGIAVREKFRATVGDTTKSVSLKLYVEGIPTPEDPETVVLFYTANWMTKPTAADASIPKDEQFLGGHAFFNHHKMADSASTSHVHGGATGLVLDLTEILQKPTFRVTEHGHIFVRVQVENKAKEFPETLKQTLRDNLSLKLEFDVSPLA